MDKDIELAALADAVEDRNARIVALEALVVALLAQARPDPGTVMDLISAMIPAGTGMSRQSDMELRIAARQHAALLMSDARPKVVEAGVHRGAA